MHVRAVALLFSSTLALACSDGPTRPSPGALPNGGAGGSAAGGTGGTGNAVPPASCDRPLPPTTSLGTGPTCRVDEDCAGEGRICQTPPRPFGLLCGLEAECTRSGFFACERGGLCAPKCSSDEACPAFERCLDGRCRARPCEDGICPAGAACSATFTCVPVPCEGGRGSCGEQELCVSGDPHFTCVPKPCDEDAACAPAGLCIAGGCRAKICGCDADCGTAALCIGGRCASEPGACVAATDTGR